MTEEHSQIISRLDEIIDLNRKILVAIKPVQEVPLPPIQEPKPEEPKPEPDGKVVLEIDWTGRKEGTYTNQMFKADFKTGTSLKTTMPATVEKIGGKTAIISHYPKDTWGDKGGYNQVTELTKVADKLEKVNLSYSLYFEPGFDWGLVNKLPGVGFGPSKTLGSGGKASEMPFRGSTVRILWEKNGQLAPYVYHHGEMPDKYGDNLNGKKFFKLESGREYKIELIVEANEIGKANGVMEVKVDGITRFINRGLILRTATTPKYIETLLFNTFMGGDDERFKSGKNQKMGIYNLKLTQL